MSELLIGRQPIFDRQLNVVAYELLYRSVDTQGNKAVFTDGDQATTQVILNAFSSFGLDSLVGDVPAYINATQNFLLGKYPIPLPPGSVVLEVLEDIPVDNKLIEALNALKQSGYTIALDDVTDFQLIYPLLGYASVVKVDLMGLSKEKLYELSYYLRRYDLKLLAEKVETEADLEYCRQLGFDYFQGYFLCRPSVVRGRGMDSSRLVLLRSLATIQDPKTSFSQMESIIAQDVTLSYKLLKLVNSAHYGTRAQIKSIAQAISMIGVEQLKGWITLLLMAAVQNKPHELTVIAMTRARMCQTLARKLGREQQDSYFLLGLLSVLDALLDIPLAEALGNLPVSEALTEGLLKQTGPYGQVLSLVLAYEVGNWEKVITLIQHPGLLRQAYLEAVQWTEQLLQTVDQG